MVCEFRVRVSSLEFCFRVFAYVSFEKEEALVKKMKALGHNEDVYDQANSKALDEIEKQLTPEKQAILRTLKGRRMVRPEDSLNIDNFLLGSVDGLCPRLERGNLGLQAAKKAEVKFTSLDPLSYLNGEARKAGKTHPNFDAQTNGVNGYSNGEASFVKSSITNLNVAEVSASHVLVDEATGHRLISSLQQSAEDLETSFVTVVRYVDAVSLSPEDRSTACIDHVKNVLTKLTQQGRQTALVNIGGDFGILEAFTESETLLSPTQLAKADMADPLLISRIVRYMVANRLVGDTAPDQYVASKKMYVFADSRIEHSIRFFYAVSNPAYQALLEFLKETGYQNESKGNEFQKALGRELELYPGSRSGLML